MARLLQEDRKKEEKKVQKNNEEEKAKAKANSDTEKEQEKVVLPRVPRGLYIHGPVGTGKSM
jgi:predicted ATPase